MNSSSQNDTASNQPPLVMSSLRRRILTLYRKIIFRIRWHNLILIRSALRSFYWRVLGMNIGSGTRLAKIRVTWPHRITIGRKCNLERDVYLKVSGGYAERISIDIGDGCFVGSGCEFNALSRIVIGQSCLIASGTRFVDHDHGTALEVPMKEQPEYSADIHVGANVWFGVNCIVLKGVSIGSGAIIAAGSVVTRSVPPLTIVAGVPARVIRQRT